MVKVNYVAHDGTKTEIEGDVGNSVMLTAVNNGVDGIIGECGGSMACATCHVYVDEEWIEKTGTRSEGEADLLEFAMSEVKPTSRLSCQIELSEDLDGLTVHMPESQV